MQYTTFTTCSGPAGCAVAIESRWTPYTLLFLLLLLLLLLVLVLLLLVFLLCVLLLLLFLLVAPLVACANAYTFTVDPRVNGIIAFLFG